MQFIAKKLLPLASISLMAAMPCIQADYTDDTTPVNDQNYSNPTPQQQRQLRKDMVINPPARPEVKDGVDLFLTADYLIWQANESGLGYAVQNNSPSATTVNSGSVKNPHFKYKSGFRVGAGYNLPHDGWDINLNWTWLHDHAHGNANFDGGSKTLFTTFINAGTTISNPATANEASAHWRLRLNDLNLELGREFYTSKWLTLRPHVGLRSAWLQQKYNVDYETVTTSGVITYSDYDVKMKNNYWGIGLDAGLDTQWGFGSGWSLYGNFRAALLYGFFHVDDKETGTSSTSGATTVTQSVSNGYHAGRAVTDLQLGVRWDHMFFHDAFHLGIHAGWEHHMYFSQNQFMRFTSGAERGAFIQNQGDLAMQGWTIGMRFDF